MPQDKWMEIKAAAELSFAQLYQCHKRSEDAILCCQKALSYIERSKGESNLECIPVHKKMAGVARVLGDYATAIQHLVKAHFIALRKSPSSGEAAETAHLVARAAVSSKRPEHYGEIPFKGYEWLPCCPACRNAHFSKCCTLYHDFVCNRVTKEIEVFSDWFLNVIILDVFIIWTHGKETLEEFHHDSNNFRPTINLSLDQSTQEIHFLDTTVLISDGHINTTLYRKLICKLDTINLGLNKDWEWMGHYRK
ncbi:unnamed protein product [Caretta caretta]